MNRDDTPAIRAHKASIANAQARNKQAWLDLFADDATVHDPVGASPHDPNGEGFTGKARLEEFWDTMIATGDLIIVSHRRIASGEHHCACAVTATNKMGELKTHIEMIVTYEVNAAGKLTRLSAYWDMEALAAQL